MRRIRSIALVHEILSRESGDDVVFADVVRPLVRMVEDALVSPDRPVRFRISGDAGVVASPIATSLAVVLTELLQNVVEHASPAVESGADGDEGPERGDEIDPDEVHVDITFRNDGRTLVVEVVDDGVGFPAGFDWESTHSLGLTIVRTLVTTELDGSIDLVGGAGPVGRPGARFRIRVPVGPA